MKSISTGAATKFLTKTILDNLEIIIPKFEVQRRIADILSAYDDLIENNMRRIRILEQMAQAIYQEWFGKVNNKPLPVGWELTSLEKIFGKKDNVVLTGPFGSKLHAHDYRDAGTPLILVKHVKNGYIVENNLPLVGDHKVIELDKYRLKEGDIVVTRVGFVGEIVYIHKVYKNWLFSGQTLRVRLPKNDFLNSRYLAQYYLTDEFRNGISNFAVGATRPSLNTEILLQMEFPLPPLETQLKFFKVVEPIDELIINLRSKNSNLRQTRDLLLPRLVSGETELK